MSKLRYKRITILDQPEEVIQRYLKATGKTREEVEASIEESKQMTLRNANQSLSGTNPKLKEKFTSDIGFEIVD